MIKLKLETLLQNDNVRKFIMFFFVGVAVFIIYTLTLWLFKRVIGFGTSASVTIAFGIAVVCNFLLNNFFTFQTSDAMYKKRIFGYMSVVACNYIINILIVNTILNNIINNVLIASTTSAVTTMFFNFFILNKIVFSDSRAM